MKIVFIHQNFPSQFKRLAPRLAENPENNVIAISATKPDKIFENVPVYVYQIKKNKNNHIHKLLVEQEAKILRGEAVAKVASKLKEKEGFYPDVIYAHPGWGELLFIKEVWPNSKIIAYFEYFYQEQGQDVNFDPEFPIKPDDSYRLRLKNFVNYQALEYVDKGITPTHWQHNTYPKWARNKISVIHEGIDTKKCKPDKTQQVTLPQSGINLDSKQQIITYISRNLEPLRGFHCFMRALPKLLQRYPEAHVLILGDNGSGYGETLSKGKTHKNNLLREMGDLVNPKQVHFLGSVPYDVYINVLQISTVHVYLTYPFIVSWSLLEAMSCSCAIVASKTQPVEEFIKHKKQGLLVDFFNQEQLIKSVSQLLDDDRLRNKLGKNARKHILKHYKFDDCMKHHLQFITQ